MSDDKNEQEGPDKTTMEGMIWSANAVLDAALDPEQSNGVPKELFEKCQGIVLLSIVTAGFVFSGHSGSGVVMAKQQQQDGTNDTKWSPPSACGLVGYGFGVLAGKEVQDAMIFIMDQETMQDFAHKEQTRAGINASVAWKKFGRDHDAGIEAPNQGTVTVNFHKGAFVAASIEVGTLGHYKPVDAKFYGKKVSPHRILLEPGAVEIPPDSGIPDLHAKLELLAKGQTAVPSEPDLRKSERLRVEAVEAGEAAKAEPDVEYVDRSQKGEETKA